MPNPTENNLPPVTNKHSWQLLALCIAACVFVGIAGGWATASSIETWYPTLQKPALTPPNWIFAPVWTTLYILMGISAWRVLMLPDSNPRKPLLKFLFIFQLFFNGIWSFLFFQWHLLFTSLVDILTLLIAITGFLLLSWKEDKLASVLFIPYLLWVGFASWLNWQLWQLNPPF